jgi:hypothetical protein
MAVTVNLEYYKDNGTFYSEGSYTSNANSMSDIKDEVSNMNNTGLLPEVSGKYKFIHISVTEDTMWSYPCLIVDD